MREIRQGLQEDVSIYAKPEFDNIQMREIRRGLQEDVDMSIYDMIPEATRHLYGETPEEIVKNYLKEHQGEDYLC